MYGYTMKRYPKFDDLTGQSSEMKLVFRRIKEAASTNVTVLILGESGTGKELVAQSIHKRSDQSKGPFIPVNTGAISHELVASELFGHQKGAFTGANETKPGKFELANGGTIFLDEVSSMDKTTQISLLRVIETKKIQRIGGKRFIDTDVRIIAASNEDLLHVNSVDKAIIRKDLFHRLSVFTITLAPLREREGDIVILAEELLHDACKDFNKEIRGFKQSALAALTDYPWPGNVREMKNVIQRAVLITRDESITSMDLPQRVRTSQKSIEDIVIKVGSTLKDSEKIIITKTLAMTKGNRKKAAEILGISRRALYNKLQYYELE